MPTLSYPGVYVEEVPSGVRTITGVSTSIAAFLGRASKGAINEPKRLLSYADYERTFGAAHPQSDLADSVKLFFVNGGTDCYVVRLALGPAAASVVLESLASQNPPDANVLVATAKAEGSWGNTIRLEVDYNTTNADETFNLRLSYEENGSVVTSESFTALSMDPDSARFAPTFVSSSSQLIDLDLHADVDAGGGNELTDLGNSFQGYSQSRRPFADVAAVRAALDGLLNPSGTATPGRFEISVDGTAYIEVNIGPWATADINAASLADIASRFQQRINDALDTVSGDAEVTAGYESPAGGPSNLLTIRSTSATSVQTSVRIRRASSNDITAPLMLGVDQGGIEPVRYSNFRPAPTASIVFPGDPATGMLDSLATLNALTVLEQDAITALTINGTAVALDLVTAAAGTDLWHVSETGYSTVTEENDGVREKLRLIANAITNSPDVDYEAEVWGYTLALIPTTGTLNELPSSASTSVADFDDGLILNTRQYTLGTGGLSEYSNSGAAGDDGTAPDAATYEGSQSLQTGFHALDPVDLFNLMILPHDDEVTEATMMDLWGPACTYCASRRAILLIDPPAEWTDAGGRPEVVQDTSLINTLRARLGDLTDYAAVFYPPLRITTSGVTYSIGPAGAIAGLMARIDASRGVWKAPAGIEAGLRNISGLELTLTDAENGVLNKKGVNCLRVFPSGIVNWGARTLDGDDDFGSEWKYIPIRRTALFLAESLYRGTRWAVFEGNDEPLWANLRLNINAFMFSLFRQGAFQGTSPQDAYYVKCDKETTTQDDRNKGIVNIEVGFAPLKPAEFVVIKIQQMAGEL